MIKEDVLLFVRPMELADISQVAEIEREAFPEPWPTTDFKRELTFNKSSCYLVACRDPDCNKVPGPEPEAGDCGSQPSGSRLERLKGSLKRLFGEERVPAGQEHLVLGYAGLWFVADEAHLSSIAVHQSYRRQGTGELLLIRCIEIAGEHNASFVTLEVRISNQAAQALYEKYGFAGAGIRRGYYTDNKEDALIMTADRITSASFQSNFQRLKETYVRKWGGKS